MMTATIKKGDKVSWNTSQGRTQGTIVRKQVSPAHIKKHKIAARKDNPEFIVRSEKSGKSAAHKATALTKID